MSGYDYYPTPAIYTHLLLGECPPPGNVILEPAAGKGHIAKELVEFGYTVDAVEIDIDHFGELSRIDGLRSLFIEDWFSFDLDTLPTRPDAIITNPPFYRSLEYAYRCVESDIPYVALFLRLGFLATISRVEFHEKHPVTALYPAARRPSFTGNRRTDSQEYSWFVWIKDQPPLNYRVLL
jgi:predicted RNA methylase